MLSNGSSNGANITYLTFKSGKNYPTPVFARKNGEDEETFTNLSGYIESIETVEGKFWPQYHITLSDNGEKYKIQFGFNNNLSVSILNALANIDDMDYVDFSCYKKNEYGRVSVKAGKNSSLVQTLSWKYDIEEIKALTDTVTVNGVPQADKTRLFEYMRNVMIPEVQKGIEAKF